VNFTHPQTCHTPLFSAVTLNKQDVVGILLDHGADMEIPDSFNAFPLWEAVRGDNRQMVQILLDAGAVVDPIPTRRLGNNKESPLRLAALKQNFELAEMLLVAGANPSFEAPNVSSLVHFVKNKRWMDLVTSHGVDLDIQDAQGKTALFIACTTVNAKLIKLLLDAGADPHTTFLTQTCLTTMLTGSIQPAFYEATRYLLDAKCDPNYADSYPPLLSIAMDENEHNQLAGLYLDHGADPNLGKLGNFPVHYVFDREPPKIQLAQLLLDHGATFNMQDNDGNTPLHIAAQNLNIKAVKFLVKIEGLDCSLQNNVGDTALHICCRSHNDKFVSQLVQILDGSEVNLTNDDGDTPLHCAALDGGDIKIVHKLLEIPTIDLNIENNNHESPVLASFKNQNSLEICKLLLTMEGVDINSVDKKGNSCLHFIAESHNDAEILSIVKTFEGLDPNIVNSVGKTPIVIASDRMNKDDIFEGLVGIEGIDVNFEFKGKTPLHMCCARCPSHALFLLYHPAIELNAQDQIGNTPIHNLMTIIGRENLITEFSSRKELNLTIKNGVGKTPLHIAAESNPSYLSILLENCDIIDVNAPNLSNQTALHILCSSSGHLEILDDFIRHPDTDFNIKDNYDRTPIHHAARVNIEYVEKLLEVESLDINNQDDEEKTVLHYIAAVSDYEHLIDMLKERKNCDCTIKDSKHNTALHIAAERNPMCLMTLLDFELVDVNSRNGKGETISHLISKSRSSYDLSEIIEKLVSHEELDLNIADTGIHKENPLHVACSLNPNYALIFMDAHLININAQTTDGNTVLHILSRKAGNPDLINKVIHYPGIDFNLTQTHSETVLHLLAKSNQSSVISDIVQMDGVDLNIQDSHGDTFCHVLARHCTNVIFDKIVTHHECDIGIQNNSHETPLHIAAKEHPFHCEALLTSDLVNLIEVDEDDNTALMILSGKTQLRSEHKQAMDAFLAKPGVDVNQLNSKGESSLVIAARNGNYEYVEKMFEMPGVDLNLRNETDGNTALHYAFEKFPEYSLPLFKNHFDLEVNAQNFQGETPLHLLCAVTGAHSMLQHFLTVYSEAVDLTLANVGEEKTPLHLSAEVNEHCLIQLLDCGNLNINAVDHKGNTVLHISCSRIGNRETFEKLMSNPDIDVNILNNSGLSPLLCYLNKFTSPDPRIGLLLGNEMIDLNIQDPLSGNTALHKLCLNGKEEFVTKFVNSPGVDLNIMNNGHETPLLISSRMNSFACTKPLLENPTVDVNVATTSGNTALHMWVGTEEVQIVKNILDNPNLEHNVANNEGKYPVHIAFQKNRNTALSMIDCEMTDINIQDNQGTAPAHQLATLTWNEGCTLEMWNRMSSRLDFNPNIQDGRGNTPLSIAIRVSPEYAYVMLEREDCDVNIPNSFGELPLHIVIPRNNQSLFDKILERTIPENLNMLSSNSPRGTPLHVAASNYSDLNFVCIRAMVMKGADPLTPNSYGETPLLKACSTSINTPDMIIQYFNLFINELEGDVHQRNSENGRNLLHQILLKPNATEECFRWLTDKGIDPYEEDNVFCDFTFD